MKLTKTQRRLASKLLFPFIALCMMTTAMALAGTANHHSSSSPTAVSTPSR